MCRLYLNKAGGKEKREGPLEASPKAVAGAEWKSLLWDGTSPVLPAAALLLYLEGGRTASHTILLGPCRGQEGVWWRPTRAGLQP